MENPERRGNRQVWNVGCSVDGELERDGVKVFVGMLKPKPEAQQPKELFSKNRAKRCRHFRPVVNLDIYGETKDEKIALGPEFQPEVVVTVYLTDYDRIELKGTEPDIYFWNPDSKSWEDLDSYADRKEITDIRRDTGAVSFRVLSWPTDDRFIACGG